MTPGLFSGLGLLSDPAVRPAAVRRPDPFPRRRSSLGLRRGANNPPIPPPPAKRERINAGRAKLIARAERSRLRSEAAKARAETGEASR